MEGATTGLVELMSRLMIVDRCNTHPNRKKIEGFGHVKPYQLLVILKPNLKINYYSPESSPITSRPKNSRHLALHLAQHDLRLSLLIYPRVLT